MYNRSVGAADREGAVMRSTRRFEEDEVSATVSRDGWEGRKKGGWDVGGAHEASTKEDGWMDGWTVVVVVSVVRDGGVLASITLPFAPFNRHSFQIPAAAIRGQKGT